MGQIDLKNIVWQEGEHFVAQCLNVDVSSFGDTKEEASANLKEALEFFLKMPRQIKYNRLQIPKFLLLP